MSVVNEPCSQENNIHVDDASPNLLMIQVVFDEQIFSRSDFS